MGKILSALALAVALAGSSQAGAVVAPPAKAVSSDQLIEHLIQAKFAKSKINVEHFTVSVKGGVATIEGKTNVIQHKGVATRLAKSGGATSVKNHILVSDAAKAAAAAKLHKGDAGAPLARATVTQPK